MPMSRFSRRGMTFLEVVAATAMLGLIGAAIFSTFSFVLGTQARERQRLAAMEVANRLVIAYLSDPTKMPDPKKLLDYGPPDRSMKFRWQYIEEPIQVVEAVPDGRDTTRQSGLSPDRFMCVRVKVWLSEQSGGAEVADGWVPQAELWRMLDPTGLRNPDQVNQLMSNSDAMRSFVNSMMGTSNRGSGSGVTFSGSPCGRRETSVSAGRATAASGVASIAVREVGRAREMEARDDAASDEP
jgi:type II secretory pathway pseudopilin PulG